MKNQRVVFPLLASLLFASVALAQAGSRETPDAPQPQPSAMVQPETNPVAGTAASGEDRLISQARQYPRVPRRATGSRRGTAYSPWYPPPPALSPVGALIGFGVGAALGASGSADGTVKGHVALGLLGGTLGALIGGAIGAAANPFMHVRRVYRPSGPDDDEEAALRSDTRKVHSERSVPAKAASPSQQTVLAGTALLSSRVPSGRRAIPFFLPAE
jgi:hypothetical protein